ncbi:MAG TPA: hypothetical protein VF380_01275 [Solirubrobacteraceae bacterium]
MAVELNRARRPLEPEEHHLIDRGRHDQPVEVDTISTNTNAAQVFEDGFVQQLRIEGACARELE